MDIMAAILKAFEINKQMIDLIEYWQIEKTCVELSEQLDTL